MSRLEQYRPVRVKVIPEVLEQGVLYVSFDYSIAIHLCACGCGEQTVTPFGVGQHCWDLIEHKDIRFEDGEISLSPSIGNFRMPCKSHYFIEHNKVRHC